MTTPKIWKRFFYCRYKEEGRQRGESGLNMAGRLNHRERRPGKRVGARQEPPTKRSQEAKGLAYPKWLSHRGIRLAEGKRKSSPREEGLG